MAAYLPQGWPDGVRPPGSEEFEESAVVFPVEFICSARHLCAKPPGGCLAARCRFAVETQMFLDLDGSIPEALLFAQRQPGGQEAGL
jgi:hypothetical protein